MRKKSMVKSYAIWFVIIILTFMLITATITYRGIKNFFTEETYKTIEYAQNTKTEAIKRALERIKALKNNELTEINIEDNIIGQHSRAVGHVYMFDDRNIETVKNYLGEEIKLNKDKITEDILNMKESNLEEIKDVQEIEGQKLYYVIKKMNQKLVNQKVLIMGRKMSHVVSSKVGSGYILSYMWESYSNELTTKIFGRFLVVVVSFVVMIFIISYFMIKKMSNRFNRLEMDVANIANMNWDEPIKMTKDDEIGRLASSIDKMRIQLKKYDAELKNYFHSVSHELKTPIMIIKGYTDSILSKKYPKGDLDSSLKVIDEETDRLNNMVKNILYLNKIDFLTNNYVNDDRTNVKELLDEEIERFKKLNNEIIWSVNIVQDSYVNGSIDQWESIFNNILDNQVRYAKSIIEINVTEEVIEISNDGDRIEDNIKDKLFNAFFKGDKGNNGLGLYIVKKLLNLNKYDIKVDNQEKGVKFTISTITKTSAD